MPTPPLKRDFTNVTTPKVNELSAVEYNLNAQRTDEAYDAAMAAATLESVTQAFEDAYAEIGTKYTRPAGGIPKADLLAAVQTSLGLADTAVQPSAMATAIGNAVAGLINGAPGAYDTLKEIADKLAADDGALAALLTAVGDRVVKVTGETNQLYAVDFAGNETTILFDSDGTGAYSMVMRDANGRAKIEAGVAAKDAANVGQLDTKQNKGMVVDARDYGVVADGAPHNNVANLLDCFAAAYAAGAREVVLPAGVIDTSDANLGTVTANSGNVYTNNGGIPLPMDKPITITGHGRGVTTLRLSSGFTRGFDFGPWIADGQVYRNITIRDITFDRNNLRGNDLGPLTAVTADVTLPGNGAITVLPGLSAATWRNAKWAYTPATNAGTLKSREMWVGVQGGNVVAINYYPESFTLVSGDQIGARLSEHVIAGTYVWGGIGQRGGQAMTIKDISIERCEAINVFTKDDPINTWLSDRAFGVGVNVTNGTSQGTVTNFTVRDTQIKGGAYGCFVAGTEGTWLDNVWYIDCFHDTMLTPVRNYEAANFMVGQHAWVGRGGFVRCFGRRSGDVSCEVDQPWDWVEEDCTWEEGFGGIYRTTFHPPARSAAGPAVTTLNNGVTLTAGASSCTVTGLPNGVDRAGLVQIDGELLWYQATNLAGTAWNIWRGINGSTATSHTATAGVTFVETHKTRIHSVRAQVRNSGVMAASGIPGRAWCAYPNGNYPLPPLTIRDASVSIVGGDLVDGQILFQQGWSPEVDIQGLRVTQAGLVSAKGSSDFGTAVVFTAPNAGLAAAPVPAPRIIGRNNKLRIHGRAPNTSSGAYAAFKVWDGFVKLDLEIEAEVSLANIPTTNIAYLQNWGAYSGSLIVAKGSRLGLSGRLPVLEVGVTAPVGLFVGSTAFVTFEDVLDVTLDLSANITATNVDGTQTAKIRYPSAPDVAALVHAAATKTQPVNADEFALADSAGSWALRRFTWANLLAATKTFTNSRWTRRLNSTASAATVSPNVSGQDVYTVNALAVNTTIASPTGSPSPAEELVFRIRDNGTSRTITWGAQYRAIGVTLPTATVPGKWLIVTAWFNNDDTRWDVVSVQQEDLAQPSAAGIAFLTAADPAAQRIALGYARARQAPQAFGNNSTLAAQPTTDYVIEATAASLTFTLPTAVSNTSGYFITNGSTGNLTIATTSSQLIGAPGATTLVLPPGASAILLSNNVKWLVF